MAVPSDLSDLFFNYHNPNYEGMHQESDSKVLAKEADRPSKDEAKKAILKDARDFVEHYSRFTGGVTAKQLAEDFMNRL